jgi:iron complex transport system ATP-binding protein
MTGTAYLVEDAGCRLGGREILSGISLEVRFGEVLALVGPNGAGKSTLLSLLAGDRPAHGGRVLFDGRPVADWTPRQLARRRAVLAQANQVSFPFTVAQVVEMGRSPWRGRPEAEADEAEITAALADTDTSHLAERAFTTLSGGEKARVSLARVLAQRTPVVLLDEPTAALDLRHTEEVMAVASCLAAEGRAVVVVLHDLSLAAAWADRVAVLQSGRLAACGGPSDVLTSALVADVYGIAVDVLTEAPGGSPIVVPRRSEVRRPAPSTSVTGRNQP